MKTENRIFDQSATRTSLLEAWRLIQKKRKAGGIDGVSVEYYETEFEHNIDKLLKCLKSGAYVPEPYERINIPKDGAPGEYRPLSLPTINDKIVQQALKQYLELLFNPLFLDTSYAYRPGKGPARAISRITHIINTRNPNWIVCADIDNFFDNMDHQILLNELRKQVDEPEITKLIRMWLKIGVVNQDGVYRETPLGIAQGGIISPLLSNIYLHPFDAFMAEKGCGYVRYADNFILLSDDRRDAENNFKAARSFLEKALKLSLNRQNQLYQKIANGFVFMGIFFKGSRRDIAPKRIQRMERRLKNLVQKKFLKHTEDFFLKLNEKITGFEYYYGRLVDSKAAGHRLNLFLQNRIIDSLVYHYNKSGKRPAKTAIKTMLLPVMLFGSKGKAFLDKWIIDTANQCVRAFNKAGQTKSAKGKNPEKAADLAVKKQKNRYRKLENINRELIVESFGVFVGKNQKNVVVKKRGVKLFDFSLKKLETINILSRGITISSDVILYCSKNKIPIFFSDTFGAPLCALQNPVYGDMDLGLLQLQFLQNGHEALWLAKKIIEGKVKNQINLLKHYSRHRPPDTVYGSAAAEEIPAMKKAIKKIRKISLGNSSYQDARQKIMGCEAMAAGIYWKMIRLLLNDDAPDFTGRKHQGARDLVNSLLNYGYGFLYRQVWREVVTAGLNPKISFLHAPQGEKPVLVYDLVEEFRPQAVDRVVFSMLTKNEKLAMNKRNGLINNASRKKLIESLLEKQGVAVEYHGEKVFLKNVIKNQIRDICRHLKGEKNYKSFIGYY